MFRVYDYLFYVLYKWNVEHWSVKNEPHIRIAFFITFYQVLNLMLFSVLIDILIGVSFQFHFEKYFVVSTGIILMILNYTRYAYKNRFKNIVKRVGESNNKNMNKFALIFTIFSFIMPFLLLYLF